MPIDGLLTKWNEDRGFGFITPTVGGQEIFIHISAFPKDGRRPQIGELLSFEIEIDGKGKKRAKSVSRPTRAGSVRARPREFSTPRRRRSWLGRIAAAAIMIAIAVYGSNHFSRFRNFHPFADDAASAHIDSPVATPVPTTTFKCDGRTFCSQMTSCAEATFFLKSCPGVQMDGDKNGIPCERQWCN